MTDTGVRTAPTRRRGSINVGMFRSAVGQLGATAVMLVLPISGAITLESHEYAVWVLLVSVTSVTTNLDLGAASYVAGNYRQGMRPDSHRHVLIRATIMNLGGSLAIGSICVGAWVLAGQRVAPASWNESEGIAIVIATVLASTARGEVAMLANAAMAAQCFTLRDVLLIGQSTVAVLASLIGCFLFRTAWVLPAAFGGSSIALAIFGLLKLARTTDPQAASEPTLSAAAVRSFALWRTAATILSTILLQADRWVLAIVASPAALGMYELSWRAASLPRLAMNSVCAYLIPHSAQSGLDLAGRNMQQRRILRVFTIAAVCLFAAGAVGSVIAAMFVYGRLQSLVLIGLFASLTANGLGSVPTNFRLGEGKPGPDVPYLAVATTLAVAGWALALSQHSFGITVCASTVPLGVCSAVYVWTFNSQVRRAPRHALVVGAQSSERRTNA